MDAFRKWNNTLEEMRSINKLKNEFLVTNLSGKNFIEEKFKTIEEVETFLEKV